tara:strand:- start:59 stop:244 length:186 start_codon:yes stop_codon:yes gene_type:complete
MYRIQQEDGKFVIYKSKNALHLPCKMMKKKRVEFDTKHEAQKYIEDVARLMQNGEEYLERF